MLRVLLIDDEAPARKRLTNLLGPFVASGRVEIVGEAADGPEALKVIDEKAVDVLFLDIRMPEMDGFELVERLPPDKRPFVVFTTAYDEYAMRAFDANAVDYLLKPVAEERLVRSIEKAERLQAPERKGDNEEKIARLLEWLDARAVHEDSNRSAGPRDYVKQISVPYRDRILLVPIDKLLSIEISEGITRLHVLDDEDSGPKPRLRQHIVGYTLEQLERNLDPARFMRVHRSAIVQVEHIQEMISWFSGRYKLVLTGGHEVIASRERSKQLKERLML